MSKVSRDDYSSTGAWMIASIISDRDSFDGTLPSDAEICEAIDKANSASSLGEYIGAAWEAAGEIVYDMFPQFRESAEEEDEDGD